MRLASGALAAALLLAGHPAAARDKPQEAQKKPPDGIYAVLRDSAEEQGVRPLREGEALLVHRPPSLKGQEDEPPRYLVLRAAPDVALDLAGPPRAVKEGDSTRILLKLRPDAAAALERLTRDRQGRQVAVVLGGEVVSLHKVREVIKGGEVQITSCAPGGAERLLERLRARQEGR
jgi:preprotein translocase subunit SecD